MDIRSELKNAMNRGGEDGLEFVCEDDSIDIWTLPRIQTLVRGFDWDDLKYHLRLKDHYPKILSILVWIHWSGWSTFKPTFLEHVGKNGWINRTDDFLPFGAPIFDGPFGLDFLKCQYIFAPVVLAQDAHSSGTISYEEWTRMPFLKSKHIAYGATAVVTKELVAVKHFQFEVGTNSSVFWVAKKTMDASKWSENEQKTLNLLKGCLETNGNIFQSYTAFRHGSDFVILSPLADLDLYRFFQGYYVAFGEQQQDFTPLELLRETACLAGALHFLHYGLRTRYDNLVFAHLDLKLENILVKWQDKSVHSVGKWMLCDFGTATVKEKEPKVIVLDELFRRSSLTARQRPTGTFQGPEVDDIGIGMVGTGTDLWSLGCILAEVLAFAIKGPGHIRRFETARMEQVSTDYGDDYFYEFDQDRGAILKLQVQDWLRAQETSCTGNEDWWISPTIDVIIHLLNVDIHGRLSARSTEDQLNDICASSSSMDKSKTPKCHWTIPAALQDWERYADEDTSTLRSSKTASTHPTT